MNIRTLFTTLCLLVLTSCVTDPLTGRSNFSPVAWTKAHEPQFKATAADVAAAVSKDALRIVLAAATGFKDGQTKADFLQGLETAFYANSSTLINKDVVKKLVLDWTPASTGGPQHWTELASAIADAYVKAHPNDPQSRKDIAAAIAQGLEDAVNTHKSA